MSRSTLEYHWGKHHRAYVDNLNRQIEGTELEELSLEDIITKTYKKGNILQQFNNAAQVHAFHIITNVCRIGFSRDSNLMSKE